MSRSIKKYIKKELSILDNNFYHKKNYPLSVIQYDQTDVFNCLKTLLRGWPTIGNEVLNVEKKIKKLLNSKNAIMINSGGSANFLILYILRSNYAKKKDKLNYGDEVITPAVTWSTTVSPIIQNGLTPVFVDVNLYNYDINPDKIEKAITKKTRAIMLVHPLGHVCEMDKILKICKKHNLLLIEDTCETIGAKYKNKFAGTFGKFSSISFYQSHHISAAEGGMILTDDNYYADILRSMRANGWLREVTNSNTRKKFIKKFKNIDSSFMFPYIGFNFKPTDMGAALVSNQINKLNSFIKKREIVAKFLIKELSKYNKYLYLPKIHKHIKNSWFTFPIVVKNNKKFDKSKLTKYLTKNNIANRPIIAGNIIEQPFIKDFVHKKKELVNSELVMSSGFFIGIHHKFNKSKLAKLSEIINKFFNKFD
tara:strand:- start:719 stop:1987 length:1269 start_codon:yes stop_codon:yes gene_type:complete